MHASNTSHSNYTNHINVKHNGKHATPAKLGHPAQAQPPADEQSLLNGAIRTYLRQARQQQTVAGQQADVVEWVYTFLHDHLLEPSQLDPARLCQRLLTCTDSVQPLLAEYQGKSTSGLRFAWRQRLLLASLAHLLNTPGQAGLRAAAGLLQALRGQPPFTGQHSMLLAGCRHLVEQRVKLLHEHLPAHPHWLAGTQEDYFRANINKIPALLALRDPLSPTQIQTLQCNPALLATGGHSIARDLHAMLNAASSAQAPQPFNLWLLKLLKEHGTGNRHPAAIALKVITGMTCHPRSAEQVHELSSPNSHVSLHSITTTLVDRIVDHGMQGQLDAWLIWVGQAGNPCFEGIVEHSEAFSTRNQLPPKPRRSEHPTEAEFLQMLAIWEENRCYTLFCQQQGIERHASNLRTLVENSLAFKQFCKGTTTRGTTRAHHAH